MSVDQAPVSTSMLASLQIDSVCDEFEAAIRQGESPRISDFADRVSSDLRAKLLRELLQIDASYRVKRGQPWALESYVADYPEIKSPGKAYIEFCIGLYELSLKSQGEVREPAGAVDVDGHSVGSRATDSFALQTDRFLGRYVLLEVIGKGATAEVFRAYDVSLRREVAVKILRSELASDARIRGEFIDEARRVSVLRHEHLARVLGIGSDREPYFVAELIEGCDLAQWIAQQRAIPPKKAADLIQKIAGAVETLHRHGLIHRDIKPANIVLESSGRPVLTDFGLARLIDQENRVLPDGWIAGSVPYMSPEQANGKTALDPRSDIYSLGAVLYELLTKRRLVIEPDGSDRGSTPAQSSPLEFPAGVTKDLAAVCSKAVARERHLRYATAFEFAEDLRRYLRGVPVTARPVSLARRVVMWIRQHPLAAMLWGLAATVAIVSTILYVQHRLAQAQTAEVRRTQYELRLRREAVLGGLGRLASIERTVGWSDRALQLIGDLAASDAGSDSQSLWTFYQTGVDARGIDCLDPCDAHFLAYSPDGKQLAVAGGSQRPFLMDLSNQRRVSFGRALTGPVAWLDQDTVVQAVAASQTRIEVHSNRALADGTLRELDDPWQVASELPTGCPPLCMSRDGRHVAILVDELQVGNRHVCLWDRHLNTARFVAVPDAWSMAFDDRSRWLAIGTNLGRVVILDVHQGETVVELWRDRSRITSLAFNPAVGKSKTEDGNRQNQSESPSGLLAVGDDGGTVTLWDLRMKQVRLICPGGLHQVLALAFNNDGTLLASAGRTEIRLWDAANGELALRIDRFVEQPFDHVVDLEFSPGGKEMAAASIGVFATPSLGRIELSPGRGIHTLRGLHAQVGQILFSPSGRWIVGLDQRWNLAVWDGKTSELHHVFEVPMGYTVDNAAIAFDAREDSLFCVAGTTGTQWRLSDSQQISRWQLPPGLQDVVVFLNDAEPYLIRYERLDGDGIPKARQNPADNPRLIRIRKLLPNSQLERVAEVSDLDRRIDSIHVANGHPWLIARGSCFGDGDQVQTKTLTCWIPTGQLLDPTCVRSGPIRSHHQLLMVEKLDDGNSALHQWAKSRTPGMPLDATVYRIGYSRDPITTAVFGADCCIYATRRQGDHDEVARFLEVWRSNSSHRVLQIPIDRAVGVEIVEFDAAGERVAWSNSQGHVFWTQLRTNGDSGELLDHQ